MDVSFLFVSLFDSLVTIISHFELRVFVIHTPHTSRILTGPDAGSFAVESTFVVNHRIYHYRVAEFGLGVGFGVHLGVSFWARAS